MLIDIAWGPIGWFYSRQLLDKLGQQQACAYLFLRHSIAFDDKK